MRRNVKVKPAPISLRKAALTTSAAARRAFPAWIDASEAVVAFPAKVASPRVRDGLVLRTVTKKKSGKKKKPSDGRDAR